MRNIRYLTKFLTILFLCSFAEKDKLISEYEKLKKLELLALQNDSAGKVYVYDLTKRKDCNKTTIQYLGVIKTRNNRQYKIVSSFFVYSAANTCHGTSNIKIYDMKNRYVGRYHVEMPYHLPDRINENKYVSWSNSADCDLMDGFSVNFQAGLPKRFMIPCSKNGEVECSFSNE